MANNNRANQASRGLLNASTLSVQLLAFDSTRYRSCDCTLLKDAWALVCPPKAE
jgi:hypothetical protein